MQLLTNICNKFVILRRKSRRRRWKNDISKVLCNKCTNTGNIKDIWKNNDDSWQNTQGSRSSPGLRDHVNTCQHDLPA